MKKKKITTYTEKKIHEEPFDWFEWLNNKKFTNTNTAREKAQDWVTCACGNQCYIIDRDEYGEPKDKILGELGADFFSRDF